jgi:plasmid stability protein
VALGFEDSVMSRADEVRAHRVTDIAEPLRFPRLFVCEIFGILETVGRSQNTCFTTARLRLALMPSLANNDGIECIIKRGDSMAMLTVRNLPDDVHRALRVRAALHGHSTEAEVREILAVAVKPESRVRMGEALAALGRTISLTNEDFEVFDQVRDKTPAKPLGFE